MYYALVMCVPCEALPSSCSVNRRTYTPKVSSARLPRAPFYPLYSFLRFSLLAQVILYAVSHINGEFVDSTSTARLTEVKAGMRCIAVKCSPRISGVAAMAGTDLVQPSAKGNTTGSSGHSCAAEHRRLAGGGFGVTTGGRRAALKAQQGAFGAQIRVK
jgi:hypothetical protein